MRATSSCRSTRPPTASDGRVSIEVDPRLAHDTAATVAEAKLLATAVDRPNVLIKIPATVEGLPAITEVMAERHQRQRDADLRARPLPRRDERVPRRARAGARERGTTCPSIHSVASFFVSRVDTEIDKRLDAIGTDEAKALRGKAGVANARLAYQAYEEVFSTPRWQALARSRRARRSVRCGRRPGSRTRPTPTRCTSPSWSRRAPSTRCRRRRSTPSPTTARSPATP